MSKTHWELLAVFEVLRANRLTGEVSLRIRYQYEAQKKALDEVRTDFLHRVQIN
jgi:hypothetical protein